jgi:predicted metal-dependent HD superfamily phosphohydrolase
MNQCSEVAKRVVKETWDSLCHDIVGLSPEIELTIWTAIESRYCEPVRAYHTLEHIHDLIIISRQFKTEISDYNSVLLAIIFHDIVYDPKSNANEENSADLFSEFLGDYLHKSLLTKTVNYILATKSHLPGQDSDHDLLLFLDLDMSILGRERDEYCSYAAKIRKEYSHVEERAFNVGRSNFLRKTLQSSHHIFLTGKFQSLMESKARSNLEWEINSLESTIQESQNV